MHKIVLEDRAETLKRPEWNVFTILHENLSMKKLCSVWTGCRLCSLLTTTCWPDDRRLPNLHIFDCFFYFYFDYCFLMPSGWKCPFTKGIVCSFFFARKIKQQWSKKVSLRKWRFSLHNRLYPSVHSIIKHLIANLFIIREHSLCTIRWRSSNSEENEDMVSDWITSWRKEIIITAYKWYQMKGCGLS